MKRIKRYCATCKHLDWIAFPGKKFPCIRLGSMATTPACEFYAANPFILQDIEKLLLPLAHVIQKLPVNVLPLLTDIIATEKANRKMGFHFMEKVAYKYAGTVQDKYISDYTIARVYATCEEDSVYLISSKGFKILAPASSLIKFDDFEEMRKTMKREGKVVNPSIPNPSVKQKYGIPESLDEVRGNSKKDKSKPEMLFDKKVKKVLLNSNLAERVEKEMHNERNRKSLKDHLKELKAKPKEELGNFKVSRKLRSDDEPKKKEKLVALNVVDFSPSNPKEKVGKLKTANKKLKSKPKKIKSVSTGNDLAALASMLKAKGKKKKK